ncbi:MAG: malto-oligosyltrehalose trehalohydrolase [Gemmataceae bacterium]|nr:malto-oligosyltrehalose trehalohydrolase [Gemmataceae bacterium]
MHTKQGLRRMLVGAELTSKGVHFRVWAPRRRKVRVVLETGPGTRNDKPTDFLLTAHDDGYFEGTVADAGVGTRYRFRLDDDSTLYPDPASRFQPEGPHGPSEVVDPEQFAWTDHGWSGAGLEGQVLYEMHVGTFTPEGTWEAAARQLPELAALGVTVIEMMPVADFVGHFGWGYDGVNLFAPTRLYGTPDDLRRFVDRAHAAGIGVILDVVYNHFGPDGNYLKPFSEDYFTDRYKNEWGEAINFDGPGAEAVREFFIANAGYWIEEFHFDGLRLDATQQIFDASHDHILAAITRRVREAAAGRETLLVAENEPQEVKMVRPLDRGGYGIDALWNDDLHHSAMVALTGRNEAYYTDYHGTPQEFISAVKWGYLYQGQRYKWQKKRRGTPTLDVAPAAFVTFVQNHDQVANSGRGLRCHQLTSPGKCRAMTALMLLAPGTPMLFQGQEFAASTPFFYFADHNPELAKLVHKGRNEFLSQFPSLATPAMQELLIDPATEEAFRRSKLDFAERRRHAPTYALHRDLLQLRRTDPVFHSQKPRGVDGAVLAEEAFVLRFFNAEHGDRLLIVNFGRDLRLDPAPEPLLAPPEDRRWDVRWSSEDPKYGGHGTPGVDTEENWRVPGNAAIVLVPSPFTEASHG